jgi:hypothetical protein
VNDREHLPYDPANYRPAAHFDGSEVHPRREHMHRRKYDVGLVAAPVVAPWSGRIILAIILTASLSFFGAFLTIGNASQDACEQRQELSRALVTIVQRSEPALRDYYTTGVITKAQLNRALTDNAAAVKDLRFPKC